MATQQPQQTTSTSAPPQQQPVSKVVHVRNVTPDMNDELVEFASTFGGVTAVCHMAKINQALVEMDTVESAAALVTHARETRVNIKGAELYFSFSKSQQINQRPVNTPGRPPVSTYAGPNTNAVLLTPHAPATPAPPHRILLFTVFNPLYNINVEVMYAITSPYGNVQRIVVFTKKNVQALVEFDTVESAQAAKEALDGKDIYTGSCTLKIEYSYAQRLNVVSNTDKTHDYVTPLPPRPFNSILPSTHAPGVMSPMREHYGVVPAMVAPYPMGMPNMDPQAMDYYRNFGGQATDAHSVLMVYNIPEQAFNPDRLFNLFCVYGNVIKIKCLTAKAMAMIQMQDSSMAESAMVHLNGISLFGEHLQITFSKHPYILDSRPDKETASPSKDFTSSSLNRFKPDFTTRRVYSPSSTLYFSNLSKDFNEQNLVELFQSLGAPLPLSVKFFPSTLNPPRGATQEERSKLGHCEFADVSAAAAALVIANNHRISGYTLKLAFSQPRQQQPPQQQQQQQQQPPQQQLPQQPPQTQTQTQQQPPQQKPQQQTQTQTQQQTQPQAQPQQKQPTQQQPQQQQQQKQPQQQQQKQAPTGGKGK